MSYVFVKTRHDYSDEFDVYCSFVMELDTFNDMMANIKEKFENETVTFDTEFYFGTNEALSFDDFESLAAGVEVQTCTREFYLEFMSLTGGVGSFGFNIFSEIEEYDEDWE